MFCLDVSLYTMQKDVPSNWHFVKHDESDIHFSMMSNSRHSVPTVKVVSAL